MNKFKKTEMRTANKFARYLLAGIAGCICLFSCDIIDDIFDKDKDGKSSSKVEKAYQKIKETADEILLSDDPIGGFEAMAEEYRTMDEVEKVEARTDGLFIKFSDERVCVWFVPPDLPTSFIEPASVLEKMEIRASAKSGNGKILLINQQKGEPDREYNDQLISALNHVYTNSSNWTSSIVGGTDGSDVTLDFIRNGLSGYDVVYFIAHGFSFDGLAYIMTNTKASEVTDKEPEGEGKSFANVSMRQNRQTKVISSGRIMLKTLLPVPVFILRAGRFFSETGSVVHDSWLPRRE